jgi:serine/threonine protein kinase
MIQGQSGDEFFMNLVESALSRPREERESYLREACGGDGRLFEEVRSHVEGEERMKSFLADPLLARSPSDHPFEPGDVLDGLFQPGDILDGRFHILREVARGGMGVVYEAHDAKLDRRIALKCAQFGHRRHLPREVRNSSEVSHPNVCNIFEIHTASTRSGEIDFITMEFLDGETLSSRLKRGRIPEPEARTIARQVCEGLAEAHRNQVIHGDLKSNNILLTADPGGAMRAVITDFGMAHQPDAEPGTVFAAQHGGTPGYMAPELWRGEKSTIASDLYALGVILFELISGRRPDQIISYVPSAASTRTLLTGPSPPPEAGQPLPSVHPKWDPIVARCLDADPARRYDSAGEVLQAFAPSRTRLRFDRGGSGSGVVSGVVAAPAQRQPPVHSIWPYCRFRPAREHRPSATNWRGRPRTNSRAHRGVPERLRVLIPLSAILR